MIKKLAILLFISINLTTISTNAQTLPFANEYHFNRYLINPAAAGYNFDGLSIRLTDRQQWYGIPGAPQTGTFSLTTFAGNKNAIGVLIGRDVVGQQKRLAGQVSYSYHSLVDKYNNRHLAFGIAAQVFQYSFNSSFSDPIAKMDRGLQNATQRKIFPDAALGALFYGDKGYFGVSVFNLIKPAITTDLEPTIGYISVGRKEKIRKNLYLELTYLLKIDGNLDYEMDINAFLSFGHNFWIGTSFRTPSSLLFMTGVNYGHYSFGYAFEYSFTSVMLSSFGTHSVMLGYNIARNKKNKKASLACPAYF